MEVMKLFTAESPIREMQFFMYNSYRSWKCKYYVYVQDDGQVSEETKHLHNISGSTTVASTTGHKSENSVLFFFLVYNNHQNGMTVIPNSHCL